MIVNVNIKNLPDYAKENDGFMVARRDDNGDLWFYGLYETAERAREIAIEIGNGLVLGVMQE